MPQNISASNEITVVSMRLLSVVGLRLLPELYSSTYHAYFAFDLNLESGIIPHRQHQPNRCITEVLVKGLSVHIEYSIGTVPVLYMYPFILFCMTKK